MSPSLTGGWWRVGGRCSPVGPCVTGLRASRPGRRLPCGRPAGGSPALPAPFCPRMGDTLPSTPTSPVGALGRELDRPPGSPHPRSGSVLEGWRGGPAQCPSAPAGLQPSLPGLTALHRWRCSQLWGHGEAFSTLDTGRRKAAWAGSPGRLQAVRPKERRAPTAHGAFLGSGQHVSIQACALQRTVFTVLHPLR